MSVPLALLPHRTTVMVVDDEPLVRLFSRRTLEMAGYQVHEAADGVEALDALGRCGAIDAVITDLQMPNMDGIALATCLAGRTPPVPTLIISGFNHQHGRAMELAPLLPKPFSPQELLENLERVLHPTRPRTRRPVD